MRESVQFDILLKDSGSAVMKRFAANMEKHVKRAQAQTKLMENTLGRTTTKAKHLNAEIRKMGKVRKLGINKELHKTSTQLDRVQNKMNRLRRTNMGMGRGGGMMGAGGKGGMGMGGALLGGGLLASAARYAGPMALAYGFANAVKTGAELESKLIDIKGVLATSESYSEDAFAGMIKNMRQLGAETMFTATEIYGATKYLGMAGLDIEEINKSMKPVTNVSIIDGMGIEKAADVVTNIQTGFGIEAKNIGNVVDVMTGTFTASNTTLGELGQAFSYTGARAAQAGLGFNETAAFLGTMAKSGLKATRAGTNLRRMIVRLAAPTTAGKKAMDQLGLSFTHVNEKGDTVLNPLSKIVEDVKQSGASAGQLKDIFGMFGSEALNAVMVAKTKDGGNFFEYLQKRLENVEGIADALAEAKMKTFEGTLARFRAQLEFFSEALYNKVKPGLTVVRNGLINLFDWLRQDGNPVMKVFTTAWTVLIRTLGLVWNVMKSVFGSIRDNWDWLEGYAVLLGTFAAGIMTVVAASQIWAVALEAVAAAQALVAATNPVVLIIAGLVALVATVMWAWNKFEGFRAVILGMWEVMKDFADGLGNLFTSPWETIKTVVKNMVEFIGTQMQPIFDMIAALEEGRWADAAKAGGKALFNLTGGWAYNAIGQTGQSDSFKKGAEKAKDDSSKIDISGLTGGLAKKFNIPDMADIKKKFGMTGSTDSIIDGDVGSMTDPNAEGGGSGGGGIKGFGGGSTGGNGIVIDIHNLMSVETESLLGKAEEVYPDIKDKLAEALMDVVRDVEISYAA